jgi:hypothetical protein
MPSFKKFVNTYREMPHASRAILGASLVSLPILASAVPKAWRSLQEQRHQHNQSLIDKAVEEALNKRNEQSMDHTKVAADAQLAVLQHYGLVKRANAGSLMRQVGGLTGGAAGSVLGGLGGSIYGAYNAEPGSRFSGALRGGAKGALGGAVVGGALGTAGGHALHHFRPETSNAIYNEALGRSFMTG